jgi:hypothetical protein
MSLTKRSAAEVSLRPHDPKTGRSARTPPPTFLFLPMHFSKNPTDKPSYRCLTLSLAAPTEDRLARSDWIPEESKEARAKVAVASDCRRPRCRYIRSAPSPCQPLCRINRASRFRPSGWPRREVLDGGSYPPFNPIPQKEKTDFPTAPPLLPPGRPSRPLSTLRGGLRRPMARDFFPRGARFFGQAHRPIDGTALRPTLLPR